ncbi:hypothetical protein GWA97_08495 [Flavobacterium sp. LaA7.5]|nr:hypothetical protein [Flavobacterium salilacus subsp. altitudinum]
MAYYEKRWNIYTAQFLMKQTVLDEHQNGSVLSETYYIEIQLMKHDNPEAAYKEVNK